MNVPKYIMIVWIVAAVLSIGLAGVVTWAIVRAVIKFL